MAEPAADGSGYSWTLTAALGEMLLHAEALFGPRDTAWTVLGIDFTPDGARTWTPGNCGHIIVHLDMHALTNRRDAYCQLAHECVHLISPTGKADANVLEEGLAVWFSQRYMQYVFGEGWWSGQVKIHSYANAFALAKKLLALDADIIKKLRAAQPVIARITAEQILEQCPNVPPELAASLTARFSTERHR